MNGKIDWKKVVYPQNLYTVNDDKRTRNKKTEKFRIKCLHYKLDDKENLVFLENNNNAI